jgi:hypothetical protein
MPICGITIKEPLWALFVFVQAIGHFTSMAVGFSMLIRRRKMLFLVDLQNHYCQNNRIKYSVRTTVAYSFLFSGG